MSFLAGFNGKVEPFGETQETVCPVCHQTTHMRLFWNYDKLHILCVPVARLNRQCLAVCPRCASVFSLDKAAAQACQNGNSAFVTAPWLTLLKESGAEHAPHGGAHS